MYLQVLVLVLVMVMVRGSRIEEARRRYESVRTGMMCGILAVAECVPT